MKQKSKKKQSKKPTKKRSTKNMSKKQEKRATYNITNEAFIEAWQGGSSVEEVLASLGDVPARYASQRATVLRKKGVELKHFRRTAEEFDVKALNALAKKSLKP